MSLTEDYPDIASLLGGYFNQDWMHDYATPEDVVAAFIKENPPALVQEACRQLGCLLLQYPESKWTDMLRAINCYYCQDDNVSWLKTLEDRLAR